MIIVQSLCGDDTIIIFLHEVSSECSGVDNDDVLNTFINSIHGASLYVKLGTTSIEISLVWCRWWAIVSCIILFSLSIWTVKMKANGIIWYIINVYQQIANYHAICRQCLSTTWKQIIWHYSTENQELLWCKLCQHCPDGKNLQIDVD